MAAAACISRRRHLMPAGQPTLELFNDLIARRIAGLPGAPDHVRSAGEAPLSANLSHLEASTSADRTDICELRTRGSDTGRYGSSLEWLDEAALALDDPLVSSVLARPQCSAEGLAQLVKEIEPLAAQDACGMASVHAPLRLMRALRAPTTCEAS